MTITKCGITVELNTQQAAEFEYYLKESGKTLEELSCEQFYGILAQVKISIPYV